MATLGLGIIVSIVITTEDRITGGPDGMAVPPLVLFGWTVTRRTHLVLDRDRAACWSRSGSH